MKNNDSTSDLLTLITKRNYGKNFFLFITGMLLNALAINLFYGPYDVVPTGSSGLALLFSKVFRMDLSLVIFIISIILLVIAWIFLGKKYAIKMIAQTFIFPVFISFTALFPRMINLGETSLLLIMVFGGVILGFSSGLIRQSGFNFVGFDVFSDILYKYFYVGVGTSSIIINLMIVIICGFVFGISGAIYSLISLLVSSYVVDKIVIGISSNKVFYIITKKPEDVKNYIVDELHYSVTVINARGGYTNKKRKMLMCVVPTIEYVKLKQLVKLIDKEVFFLIVDAYDCSIKKNCKNM